MGVQVERLALNMDQINKYNPPPNAAKFTDSRCDVYVAEHGYSSWELDALSPEVMEQLIDDAVEEVVDREAFDDARGEVVKQREILTDIADNYADVVGFIESLKDGG